MPELIMKEKLTTLNRRMAEKAPQEEHECCLLKGMDFLTKNVKQTVPSVAKDT